MPIGWERWVEDISEVERTWKLENEADETKRVAERGALGGSSDDEPAKGMLMPDPGIMMALHTVAADYYWSEGQEEIMNMAFDESALMCAGMSWCLLWDILLMGTRKGARLTRVQQSYWRSRGKKWWVGMVIEYWRSLMTLLTPPKMCLH